MACSEHFKKRDKESGSDPVLWFMVQVSWREVLGQQKQRASPFRGPSGGPVPAAGSRCLEQESLDRPLRAHLAGEANSHPCREQGLPSLASRL